MLLQGLALSLVIKNSGHIHTFINSIMISNIDSMNYKDKDKDILPRSYQSTSNEIFISVSYK